MLVVLPFRRGLKQFPTFVKTNSVLWLLILLNVDLYLFSMADTTAFNSEKARSALSSILESIEIPENAVKLGEAKDNAGNDMLKMMQFVFPIVMQIQMDVIKSYGFPEGREGIVHFAQLIRTLEREDPEVAHLHAQVRAHFLPPVSISTESA